MCVRVRGERGEIAVKRKGKPPTWKSVKLRACAAETTERSSGWGAAKPQHRPHRGGCGCPAGVPSAPRRCPVGAP
eukprot:3142316-Pyramimonas_sp.AAC.1